MGNTDGTASGRSFSKLTSNLSPEQRAAIQKKTTANQTDPTNTFVPVLKQGVNGVVRALVSLSEIKANPDIYNTSHLTTPVKVVTRKPNGTHTTTLYTGYVSAKAFTPPGSQALPGNPAAKPPQADPSKYTWNLPPHQWSLPVTPARTVSKTVVDPKNSKVVNNYMGALPEGTAYSHDNDMYRRGRIWYRASDPNLVLFDSDQKPIPTDYSTRNIGFQFLWNPESISTSVAVQLDVTPTAQDRLIAVAGAFPATESLTINIRLDRTNDFACIANSLKKTSGGNVIVADNINQSNTNYHFINASDLMPFTSYYKTGFTATKSQVDIANKLVDLMERGTIADIEYLYSAINGTGASGNSKQGWTNARGIRTADIGYLMPTLLNIDIGPLSYQGYVTNLTVTHTAFNPNMVPIRSDVSIALSLLATSGLYNNASSNNSSNGTTANNTSPSTPKTPVTQPNPTYTHH